MRPADIDQAVLAILQRAERPMTAYALQDRASVGGLQLYPTQIYRTLRRLIGQDAVARVESANAYMIKQDQMDAIAICDTCGRALPIAAGRSIKDIANIMRSTGFSVKTLVVEAVGKCRSCQGRGAS